MSFVSATTSEHAINEPLTIERLIQAYKTRIYSYVCRLTNDCPDAEDITQEVFIRAYQSLAGFRHDAALDTWLYRIATNLVIDRSRRRKRSLNTVSMSDDTEATVIEIPSVDRGTDPQATAQLDELQQKVRLAVQSLPVKLRTVVVLHDIEGLSYDEVASVVGCPVGTVKSRLFNARLYLRRKLENYFDA